MEWSPHRTPATREKVRQTVREDVEERKSPYREERDRLLVLSAGSEGAARTGEEEEMEGRGRGVNGKERERDSSRYGTDV